MKKVTARSVISFVIQNVIDSWDNNKKNDEKVFHLKGNLFLNLWTNLKVIEYPLKNLLEKRNINVINQLNYEREEELESNIDEDLIE